MSTNHSHLHAALRSMTSDPRVEAWIDDLAVVGDRSGYEVIADAVAADHADTFQPEPQVDAGRLLDVEQFRMSNARVLELTPEDDPVVVPQVVLVLEGTPALMTLTGSKSYITAANGDMAIALGKGMLESGKVIKRAEQKLVDELATTVGPGATGSGLVTATPADMARAAAEARATEHLANGSR